MYTDPWWYNLLRLDLPPTRSTTDKVIGLRSSLLLLLHSLSELVERSLYKVRTLCSDTTRLNNSKTPINTGVVPDRIRKTI